MILYKYTKADYLETILKNNSFKLSSPNDYNDPFDCVIDLSDKDEQKSFDLAVNYYCFKEIEKFLLNKDVKLRTIDKIAFFSIKIWILIVRSIIRRHHLYIPYPMIDWFIHFALKSKKMKETYKKVEEGKEEFAKTIRNKVKDIRASLLLCCYGKDNDSILMWSHYADSHKGICVEFETYDDKDFNLVKYSKKRPKFDVYFLTQIILAFDYLGEKAEIKNQRTLKYLCKPLLTKSADWSYEKEVRSIFTTNENNERITKSKDKDGNDIYIINPGIIKKIYLGCKISEIDEAKVRSLVGSIPVVKMIESEIAYKVEPTK